jgi:hypothetical protein
MKGGTIIEGVSEQGVGESDEDTGGWRRLRSEERTLPQV